MSGERFERAVRVYYDGRCLGSCGSAVSNRNVGRRTWPSGSKPVRGRLERGAPLAGESGRTEHWSRIDRAFGATRGIRDRTAFGIGSSSRGKARRVGTQRIEQACTGSGRSKPAGDNVPTATPARVSRKTPAPQGRHPHPYGDAWDSGWPPTHESSRHVSPRASRSQKPSRALRSGLHADVSFGSVGARKSVPTDSSVEPRSSRHGSPRRSGFGLEGSPKSGGSERSAMLGAVEAGHLRTATKARSLRARIARSAAPLQRSPTSRRLLGSLSVSRRLWSTREGGVAGGPADETQGSDSRARRFRTVEGTSACRQPVPFAGRRSAAGLGRRDSSGGNSSSAPKLADDMRCPEGSQQGNATRVVPRSVLRWAFTTHAAGAWLSARRAPSPRRASLRSDGVA